MPIAAALSTATLLPAPAVQPGLASHGPRPAPISSIRCAGAMGRHIPVLALPRSPARASRPKASVLSSAAASRASSVRSDSSASTTRTTAAIRTRAAPIVAASASLPIPRLLVVALRDCLAQAAAPAWTIRPTAAIRTTAVPIAVASASVGAQLPAPWAPSGMDRRACALASLPRAARRHAAPGNIAVTRVAASARRSAPPAFKAVQRRNDRSTLKRPSEEQPSERASAGSCSSRAIVFSLALRRFDSALRGPSGREALRLRR